MANQSRNVRQRAVSDWAKQCFGEHEATNLPQRALRMLEEAIELFQACDAPREKAHALIDYIFDRPKGTVNQELGGVGVTILALAAAAGVSAEAMENLEVIRILSKPRAHFSQRNAVKNSAGFKV